MDKIQLKAVAQAIAEVRTDLATAIDQLKSQQPADKTDELQEIVNRAFEGSLLEVGRAFDRATARQDELRTELQEVLKAQGAELCQTQQALQQQLQAELSAQEQTLLSLKGALDAESASALQRHADALAALADVGQARRDELALAERQLGKAIDSVIERLERGLQQADQANSDTLALLGEQLEEVRAAKAQPGPSGMGIDSPEWAPAIYRADSVVQHYLGQHFKALVDTAQEPGTGDEWERIGSAGLRHRGGFDADAVYKAGDIYARDFASILVREDGKHVLLSARGAKGLRGDQGLPGPTGIAGERGEAGATIKAVHADERGFAFETTDNRMLAVPMTGLITREALLHSIEDATDFASLKRSLVFLCGGSA